MNTGLKALLLLLAVVVCSLSAMARVGNQFEFSNEEAEMVFTITSEDPKEVELTEYTRKGEWPFCLTIPETAIDDERNVEFAITSIGPGVFEKTPIRHLTLPKTVKKLGKAAFYNSLLLGADIRGVEEIEDNCFASYYPQGNLDGPSFFYSGGLQYVVLGSSIKRIGSGVFRDQALALTLISYSTEAPIVEERSDDRFNNITTYVPVGSMEDYINAKIEGKWLKDSPIEEFKEDILLCAGSRKDQVRYFRYNYNQRPDAYDQFISVLIGNDIPCIATWTLCEVDNEFGPQPEPSIRWATSNDKAMITEDGVITGISEGYSYAVCHLALENPEVSAEARIHFRFCDPNSGVESVEADVSVPARIYDLNGREVTGQQLDHGIYIRVTGSHTDKIAL